MGGMFWIITGAQYLINSGDLKYTIIPVTTDGCDAHLLTTIVNNVTEAVVTIAYVIMMQHFFKIFCQARI